MEQTYFFPGQEIESEDLNDISTKLGEQLKHRTVDFFSKGAVSDASGTFVFNDLDNTIQIQPFIAYTDEGERIDVYKAIRRLALNLSDPTERRLTHQGSLDDKDFGWELNTNYDIYVAYITKVARPRAHKVSGEFFPTRIISGFEFYAIRPGIDPVTNNEGNTPLVRLCRLVYDGTDVVITSLGYLDIATIDAAKIYTKTTAVSPTIYNPKNAVVSMEDHVLAIGSGTPTPTNPHGLTPADIGVDTKDVSQHETEMHTPGLLANRSSVNSAFYIILNSISELDTRDNLIFYNLKAAQGERLHHNGTWIDSYAYTPDYVFIHFDYGTPPTTVPVPSGLYTLALDTVTRKLVVASNEGAGYTIRVAGDSSGYQVLDEITVMNRDEYESGSYYPLATFRFSQVKIESEIISSFATPDGTSNFVTKDDLRVFGSLSSSELQTTKQVISGAWTDVLKLPYEVQVSSLSVGGSRITGDTTMPFGYIRGFNISYNSTNSITVYPGRCRDMNGTADISLTTGITKYVTRQWEAGGYGSAVGGLQNTDGNTSALSEENYGGPLHVFVIQNIYGIADIALDTSVTGAHITGTTSAPTSSYPYIRRIGTIYLSHRWLAADSANREYLRPFSSYLDNGGLYIQYRTAPTLIYDTSSDAAHLNMYDPNTQTFIHTYVPSGYPFKGKFSYTMGTSDVAVKVEDSENPGTYNTYTMHQSASGSIFLPTAPNTPLNLQGAGEFELYMENGTITTNGTWDFNNTLTCLGYYDSRDIL